MSLLVGQHCDAPAERPESQLRVRLSHALLRCRLHCLVDLAYLARDVEGLLVQLAPGELKVDIACSAVVGEQQSASGWRREDARRAAAAEHSAREVVTCPLTRPVEETDGISTQMTMAGEPRTSGNTRRTNESITVPWSASTATQHHPARQPSTPRTRAM